MFLMLPKIKKRIKSFILEEEGKISKQSILKIGSVLLFSIIGSKDVFGGCGGCGCGCGGCAGGSCGTVTTDTGGSGSTSGCPSPAPEPAAYSCGCGCY